MAVQFWGVRRWSDQHLPCVDSNATDRGECGPAEFVEIQCNLAERHEGTDSRSRAKWLSLEECTPDIVALCCTTPLLLLSCSSRAPCIA